MCIHVTAATRALLDDADTGWADYGHREIKGASRLILCDTSYIPNHTSYAMEVGRAGGREVARE